MGGNIQTLALPYAHEVSKVFVSFPFQKQKINDSLVTSADKHTIQHQPNACLRWLSLEIQNCL